MNLGELGNLEERHCCTPMKYAIEKGLIIYNSKSDTYTIEEMGVGYRNIVIIFYCPICGKPLYKNETYR